MVDACAGFTREKAAALAIRKAAHGSEHRLVGESLNNLAVLMREQGRYDEAAGYYREAVDLRCAGACSVMPTRTSR